MTRSSDQPSPIGADGPGLDPLAVACLEEARQAVGVIEIACEHHPLAGGVLGYDGPGSEMTRARGIGLDGPVAPETLDELVRFYAERGCEPAIELAAYCDQTLVRGLADRGFVLGGFAVILARALDNTDGPHAAAHPPDDVRLRVIDREDDADVAAVVRVVGGAFLPDDRAKPDWWDELLERAVRRPSMTTVAAERHGPSGPELIGAGSVMIAETRHGRAASLVGAGVEPRARRRGVQAALIRERLRIAARAGCAVATIEGRPGADTERNARRQSFTPSYTRCKLHRPGGGLAPSNDIG